MRQYLFACSAVSVLAFSVGVAAQNPTPSTQSQPGTTTAQPGATTTTQPATPTAQSPGIATVEGCLVREQDVPGRKPNVAERAGVLEDYILTSAKVVKGTPPAGIAQARPGEPTGTSGTLSSSMFDVKGIDDARLKQFVGKRVQIDGTFADVNRSPSATPTEDLVDIQGTTIRQASGDCSAK